MAENARMPRSPPYPVSRSSAGRISLLTSVPPSVTGGEQFHVAHERRHRPKRDGKLIAIPGARRLRELPGRGSDEGGTRPSRSHVRDEVAVVLNGVLQRLRQVRDRKSVV